MPRRRTSFVPSMVPAASSCGERPGVAALTWTQLDRTHGNFASILLLQGIDPHDSG